MSGGRVTHVRARLSLLRAEDGGRATWVASGYRPNWVVGPPTRSGVPTLAAGAIRLIGRERLDPGDEGEVEITAFPRQLWESVHVGEVIEVREGPLRLVGMATILAVDLEGDATPR